MKNKGKEGEMQAASYLERSGLTILERNFRWGGGEIDLIALEDETVVFCEVKTWDTVGIDDLGYSINTRKIQKIHNTAQVYLQQNQQYSGYRFRFDVLFLSEHMQRIRHIPNAFTWSDAV